MNNDISYNNCKEENMETAVRLLSVAVSTMFNTHICMHYVLLN